MYEYRGRIIELVDADTYDIEVDLGFYISHQIRLRLLGVDTHEIYGVSKDTEEYKKGMDEMNFVKNWLESARNSSTNEEFPLVIQTHKDERGKYGRYLGDVFHPELGASLSDSLVDEYGESLLYDP